MISTIHATIASAHKLKRFDGFSCKKRQISMVAQHPHNFFHGCSSPEAHTESPPMFATGFHSAKNSKQENDFLAENVLIC